MHCVLTLKDPTFVAASLDTLGTADVVKVIKLKIS